MADYTITELAAEPYFDLELLMSTSQESRIGGDMMDRISAAWDRWLPHTHARQIEGRGVSYLLVWLDETVEDEVDDAWEDTPSEAFMFNALAQVMCMGMVHALVPEVEDAGCAPAPRPTETLARALDEAGVPYTGAGEPGLSRRYAVVTHFPFKGGCEICTLQANCPKAGGAGGPHTVTLPGFE